MLIPLDRRDQNSFHARRCPRGCFRQWAQPDMTQVAFSNIHSPLIKMCSAYRPKRSFSISHRRLHRMLVITGPMNPCNQTSLINSTDTGVLIRHDLDTTAIILHLWSGPGPPSLKSRPIIFLISRRPPIRLPRLLACTEAYQLLPSPGPPPDQLPVPPGSTIGKNLPPPSISTSTDPRAPELERRIILSQQPHPHPGCRRRPATGESPALPIIAGMASP